MPSGDLINIESLLINAVLASKKAGEAIMEVYDSDFKAEQKKDRSPVTSADIRSHKIISRHLLSSGHIYLPLLSEEGRYIPYSERQTWEYYWLVDPLDGTKEFINRNDEFTVNIALMRKDMPVIGVIYVPARDILYFAAEATGAFKISGTSWIRKGFSFEALKGKACRLPIQTGTGDKFFTAIASRSHISEDTRSFLDRWKKEHGEFRTISAGSSLKFCLVAEGAADIYPRFGPTMEWDTAAGQAIVEQAGGVALSNETGESLKYNKEELLNPWFIVKGPGLHQA